MSLLLKKIWPSQTEETSENVNGCRSKCTQEKKRKLVWLGYWRITKKLYKPLLRIIPMFRPIYSWFFLGCHWYSIALYKMSNGTMNSIHRKMFSSTLCLICQPHFPEIYKYLRVSFLNSFFLLWHASSSGKKIFLLDINIGAVWCKLLPARKVESANRVKTLVVFFFVLILHQKVTKIKTNSHLLPVVEI